MGGAIAAIEAGYPAAADPGRRLPRPARDRGRRSDRRRRQPLPRRRSRSRRRSSASTRRRSRSRSHASGRLRARARRRRLGGGARAARRPPPPARDNLVPPIIDAVQGARHAGRDQRPAARRVGRAPRAGDRLTCRSSLAGRPSDGRSVRARPPRRGRRARHRRGARRSYRDTLGPARRARSLPIASDRRRRSRSCTVGESKVELVQPTDDTTGVARFLAARGEGFHHVCFEVADLAPTLDELAADGVELIDRAPRRGAEGPVAFLHPRSRPRRARRAHRGARRSRLGRRSATTRRRRSPDGSDRLPRPKRGGIRRPVASGADRSGRRSAACSSRSWSSRRRLVVRRHRMTVDGEPRITSLPGRSGPRGATSASRGRPRRVATRRAGSRERGKGGVVLARDVELARGLSIDPRRPTEFACLRRRILDGRTSWRTSMSYRVAPAAGGDVRGEGLTLFV